jgi:hypothetical protein
MVRTDVEPLDLLRAVGNLCLPANEDGPDHARRMVALLVDGLRYGAASAPRTDSRPRHPFAPDSG